MDFLVFVGVALVGAATGWLLGRGLGRFDGSGPAIALGVVLVGSLGAWLGLTIWLEDGLRTAIAAWFLCVVTGLVGFSRMRRSVSARAASQAS